MVGNSKEQFDFLLLKATLIHPQVQAFPAERQRIKGIKPSSEEDTNEMPVLSNGGLNGGIL